MRTKPWRTLARWTTTLFLVVFLILALGALFTQTPWCRNLVRTFALNAINDAIRGPVHIGAVDGNLLTTIELKDAFVVEGSDTVATISHIRLRYDLSGIPRGVLEVDSVMVDMPQLFLRQRDDGQWNLLTAFAPAQPREEKEEDTTKSTFRVTVKRLIIKDACIRSSSLNTSALFPREIRMSLEAYGSYAEGRQELAVTMMQAKLSHPDIAITQCTFSAEHTTGNLALRDFVLTTPGNRLEVSGKLTATDETRGSATVAASFPDLTELAFIVPHEFRSMHPEIRATVGIEGERLDISCSLRDERQVVQGSGTLTLAQVPKYTFKGEFHHLDPDALRGAIPQGLDLDGTVELQGQGFRAADAIARGTLSFTDSRIGAYRIKGLHLEGDYAKGDLTVNGRLDQESGFLVFGARSDVLADSPRYSIAAESQHLDLAPMLRLPMSSPVTLHLAASGTGYAIGRMEGDLRVFVSRSMIGNVDIDSAYVHVRALRGDLSMDSLLVASPLGEVRGAGEMSRGAVISARFEGALRDAERLRGILPVEQLAGEGPFGGTVEGRLDSLVALLNFHLRGLAVNDLSAEATKGAGQLILVNGIPMVSGHATLKSFRQGGVQIDSVSVEGEYGADSVHAIIHAKDSTLFALRADAFARIDSTVALVVREFEFTQGNSRWSNGNQPIFVDINKSSVEVHGLALASAEQSISVDGLLDPKGVSSLECTVHNVDFLPFAFLMDSAFTSLGPLDAHITVGGRMDNPEIEGAISSSRVAYGGWVSDSLNGSLALRDSTLRWDITVGLMGGNRARISGFLPVQYAAADGIISRTRPADIHLFAPRLDLSTLIRPRKPFDVIAGNLAADMHLTHTLQSPRLLGTIGIDAGSLQSTSLGLLYKDIALLCTGKGDSLVLDSCQVRGGKGILTAKGTIGLGPGLSQGKVVTTNIEIAAREFEAANTSNYAATVNGTTTIRDMDNRLNAEGDLIISNAHIYLPYFTKTSGTQKRELSRPMLVTATQQSPAAGELPSKPVAEADDAAADTTQFFGGKFRVTIPRGTWVRGKTLNIELSGSLEVVKTSPAVMLFGFIKCERGTYEFYGKKFVVKEGRFDFDGGTEINPTVTIDMRYDFRDSYEQQQTLHMIMTNRLKNMNIRFTLGDEAISDADAISYLIFGRRSDELSQSQQTGIANVGEVVAKDFAAGLVSAQLSSTVGNWVGLDVVRVSGEDNWQKATFTAGKYVTNDVFATYERGLFSSDPNEPITEIARLEYQFVRSLFLRLTKANDTSSGADLIIKIE
jgi:translocation and assembly module TamB